MEVWKTDILQHSSNSPLSDISNTPPSAPRNKGTPSRKRSVADANLCQHSSTPPALRPVHIVRDTPNPDADPDSTQLDEATEKGFIGMKK